MNFDTKPGKEELLKYNAYYPPDTVFSANARLLQSKWRDSKGYNYGKYGNYLDVEFAKQSKANFITPRIQELVVNEVIHAKKEGSLIGEPRIWNNLLSSQPLCFNLFGELHYDLELAGKVFAKLFPQRIEKITAIRFEYSPGRGNMNYTGDHSAFDVFVEYEGNGRKGFAGIEVKYAESLKEETVDKANKNFKQIYADITKESRVFKEESLEQLRRPPISQIWRDHLLSLATRKDYGEGFFIFLFPRMNKQCQAGVDAYKKHLLTTDEVVSGFCARYLEDFINAIAAFCTDEWVLELRKRYFGI